MLVSGAAMAIIGVILYYTLLRRLAGQGEFTVVILTLGLAALVDSLTTVIWGNKDRVIPATINNGYHLPLNATITTYGIVVIVAAIVLVGLASLFIDHLPVGLSMRAAAENRSWRARPASASAGCSLSAGRSRWSRRRCPASPTPT